MKSLFDISLHRGCPFFREDHGCDGILSYINQQLEIVHPETKLN
jgi:hypothetical protein